MFQNKIFVFGLLFLIFVILVSIAITFKSEISNIVSPVFKSLSRDTKNADTPFIFVDESSKVDVSINQKLLLEIYTNEVVSNTSAETLSVFEPITFKFTDEKQGTSFAWSKDEHYESIAIQNTAGNGSTVFINVEPDVMRKNGWDDNDIRQEIELLVIQGILTRPSLTLTAESLDKGKQEAYRVYEKYNFESFATLQ